MQRSTGLHFGPAGAHARTRTCTLAHLRPVGRQHVTLTRDDGRQAEDVGEAAVDWLVRGIFQEVVTWMEGGRKKKTSKREDEKKPCILLTVMTLKQKSDQLLLKQNPDIH